MLDIVVGIVVRNSLGFVLGCDAGGMVRRKVGSREGYLEDADKEDGLPLGLELGAYINVGEIVGFTVGTPDRDGKLLASLVGTVDKVGKSLRVPLGSADGEEEGLISCMVGIMDNEGEALFFSVGESDIDGESLEAADGFIDEEILGFILADSEGSVLGFVVGPTDTDGLVLCCLVGRIEELGVRLWAFVGSIESDGVPVGVFGCELGPEEIDGVLDELDGFKLGALLGKLLDCIVGSVEEEGE